MSTVKTTLITDLAGTGPVELHKQSAAKAWANLNGTGTIALQDSLNVASATDNGTGDYRYNWTSAFAAATYASTTANTRSASPQVGGELAGTLVGSIRIICRGTDATFYDELEVNIITHGDLA